MRIFTILIITYLYSAGIAYSEACNIKNLPFGNNTSQIIDEYNLDILEATTSGEFPIITMGKLVCSDLPEQAVIEFIFIDDVFVKVNINTPDTSEELLQYAQNVFGENDDHERKKSRDGKTYVALWNNNSAYSVVYSKYTKPNPQQFEHLEITSKKHNKLFEQLAVQQGKAMDEYLKEHKSGKYDPSYNDSSSSNKNMLTKDTNYDPDSLEKLKNKYDKSDEDWKRRNQNTPRKGR